MNENIIEEDQILREQLRSENYKVNTTSAITMINKANDLFSDLVKIGITLSTFLFIFSSAFIKIKPDSFPLELKYLLIVSWAMSLLSIMFGILQTFLSHYFFSNNAKNLKKVVGCWVQPFPTSDEYKRSLKDSQNIKKDETNPIEWPIYVQYVLFILSFILIIITVSFSI